MTRHHALAALLAAGLLGGCATGPTSSSDFSITSGRASGDGDAPSGRTEREVYTDLIRNMLAQEQYYAALAHIQEQQRLIGNTPELRYLEGETRRKLGQAPAAEVLYRGLLRSPMAAQAYHGLGLLYAERDLGKSIEFLRESSSRRPTDAEVRNDLGYALMSAGRYHEALPELATAVELDPAGKARNNLIMLLLLSGDEAGASRVARDAGVNAETLKRLRQQAQHLKSRNPASGGRS
jgi:Flp pilus assembly protein TadD